jgi:diguanylate cyclase (GGDEF)-like protein
MFADPGLERTINRLLEGLQRNVDDDELHTLFLQGLRRFGRVGVINGNYVHWLHDQLSNYATDTINIPRARIKARLIQQHLSFFLAEDTESPTTHNRSPSDIPGVPSPAAGRDEIPEGPASHARAPQTLADETPAAYETGSVADSSDSPPSAKASIAELAAGIGSGEKPENLAVRRQRYQQLRQSEKDAWQAIYGTVRDFSRLKELWVASLADLASERDALSQKLTETTEQLRAYETETETLRLELTQMRERPTRRTAVRALPKINTKSPKRLSALPKRDVFLRQLEAEIERVRRHGSPLALALIDISDLETLSHQYGRHAADAVLHCYAGKIFSNFRTYDVVARYDKDEFAVLFPNTARDGAVRALEKAQKRATEMHFLHDGQTHPLPGFAGALTFYQAGEDPTALLGRADAALETARRTNPEQRLVIA